MRATTENTVSTVGSVSEYEPGSGRPRPAGEFCDDNARPDLVGPPPVGVSVTAGDADGADANAAFRGSPPIPGSMETPSRPGRNLTAPRRSACMRLSGCQRWHGGSRRRQLERDLVAWPAP